MSSIKTENLSTYAPHPGVFSSEKLSTYHPAVMPAP